MHTARLKPVGSSGKYSAKNIRKPVNFMCEAPEAERVSLIGEFNGWNPKAAPMEKRPDGIWAVQVELTHGHHHYLFCVDGESRLDPNAQGIARNARNERVSMIAVS